MMHVMEFLNRKLEEESPTVAPLMLLGGSCYAICHSTTRQNVTSGRLRGGSIGYFYLCIRIDYLVHLKLRPEMCSVCLNGQVLH